MCDSATLRLCFQPLTREKGGSRNNMYGGTGRKQTPRLADSRPESVHVPAKEDVILKHCRCMDCRKFSQINGECFCSEDIGGTKVTWATGKRECDPPPEAWHYCSHYDGPQISKAVLLWRRRSRHVGAGSTIAPKAEQGCDRAPGRNGRQHGQDGYDLAASVNGSFPTTYAEDRDGNSRASSFCLLRPRTRRQVPQK